MRGAVNRWNQLCEIGVGKIFRAEGAIDVVAAEVGKLHAIGELAVGEI